MTWVKRLLAIDRRIIFLLVALGRGPATPSSAEPPGHRDAPGEGGVRRDRRSSPRLEGPHLPWTTSPTSWRSSCRCRFAVIRHCFRKHLQVIAMTLFPAGTGLGERAITLAAGPRAP